MKRTILALALLLASAPVLAADDTQLSVSDASRELLVAEFGEVAASAPVGLGMCIRPGLSPYFPSVDTYKIRARVRATKKMKDFTFSRLAGETPEDALVRYKRDNGLDSPLGERIGTVNGQAEALWAAGYSRVLTFEPNGCPGPGGISFDSTWLAHIPWSGGSHPVSRVWAETIGNGSPGRATCVPMSRWCIDDDPLTGRWTLPCGLSSSVDLGVTLWVRNAAESCSGLPDGSYPWNSLRCLTTGDPNCLEPPVGPPTDPPTEPPVEPPTEPEPPAEPSEDSCEVSKSITDSGALISIDCEIKFPSSGRVSTRLVVDP